MPVTHVKFSIFKTSPISRAESAEEKPSINVAAIIEAVKLACDLALKAQDAGWPETEKSHEADALIRDKGINTAMLTCEIRRQFGFTQDLGNFSKFIITAKDP